MGRKLKFRKARKAEIRKLHKLLEEELTSWQRRRAESILLYRGGLNGVEIAKLLEVHVNTVYNDLRNFSNNGLAAIEQPRKAGTPARISENQIAEIMRLAKLTPVEIGLPYGRWSLSKLRDYLIKKRIVKNISEMHLWRLLRKGGCTFGELNANSLAMILNATRSSIE